MVFPSSPALRLSLSLKLSPLMLTMSYVRKHGTLLYSSVGENIEDTIS
ncbi:MAG: hypothetical protein JO071_13860 [Deltaproteobacteria bacterium]|nr:hypothetical protein [Deltaproteobacteria bacterium]